MIVHAFVSVKGGVGKTSLAAIAAVGFADRGSPVAVVDLDFIGTSLAHALPLLAPGETEPLDVEETRRRCRDFTQPDRSDRLPFLNDHLFADGGEFDPVAHAWTDGRSAIRWYPGEPGRTPAVRATHAVFVDPESQFPDRLTRVLQSIGEALGPDGVLILDLPPGLFGTLNIVDEYFRKRTPAITRFTYVLVSSEDRADLWRSVEDYLHLLLDSEIELRWVLNRNQRSIESARGTIRKYLGELWTRGRVEDYLSPFADWDPEGIGGLVRSERLSVDAELAERLAKLVEGPT